MPSPFPGMDPYLEDPWLWPDFHLTFVVGLRAELNRRLPTGYVARADRYVWVQEPETEERKRLGKPDVFITGEGEAKRNTCFDGHRRPRGDRLALAVGERQPVPEDHGPGASATRDRHRIVESGEQDAWQGSGGLLAEAVRISGQRT